MHKDTRHALFLLRKAESFYLRSAGWKRAANPENWIAPVFPGYEHWDSIFPRDQVRHDRAVAAQKSFDAQH